MANLKNLLKNNMTSYQKLRAEETATNLVAELIESHISFRFSSGSVGCYTIFIPDLAGDHTRFYLSDKVQLWCKNVLVYSSDWEYFDFDVMLKAFVNL